METINILLTCPFCGESKWIRDHENDEDGSFECAYCHENVFVEDMCACASDKLNE